MACVSLSRVSTSIASATWAAGSAVSSRSCCNRGLGAVRRGGMSDGSLPRRYANQQHQPLTAAVGHTVRHAGWRPDGDPVSSSARLVPDREFSLAFHHKIELVLVGMRVARL